MHCNVARFYIVRVHLAAENRRYLEAVTLVETGGHAERVLPEDDIQHEPRTAVIRLFDKALKLVGIRRHTLELARQCVEQINLPVVDALEKTRRPST